MTEPLAGRTGTNPVTPHEAGSSHEPPEGNQP